MNKVLGFLKRYWWVLPVTLLTGYFGFFGGVMIAWILAMLTDNAVLSFGIYSLVAGFFAMLPVLILIGTSKKLEKRKKRIAILLTGLSCSVLFFLVWVPEII